MAILLMTAFSAIAPEQAEAPNYRDGESWQFKMIEMGMSVQTAVVDEREFTVSFSAGRVTVRPGFMEVRKMLAIDDERQYLQFPIFVGRSCFVRYVNGGTVYMKARTSVTGMEEATTPAGSLRAFVVERRVSGSRLDGDSGRGEA